MDAIVLADGYATCLWPITKDRPKMVLPLDGTTVIGPIDRTQPAATHGRYSLRLAGYLSPTRGLASENSVERT